MEQMFKLAENVNLPKGIYTIENVLGEEHFVGDGLLIPTDENSSEAMVLRAMFQLANRLNMMVGTLGFEY